MPIIIENVSYAYRSGTSNLQALTDVNLSINAGEWVALIGPSQSGKTTLAKLVAGLLQLQSGLIQVDDIIIGPKMKRPYSFERYVGFSFQRSEDQLFGETVYDDIAFGPKQMRLDEEEVGKLVTAALLAVGLDPVKYLSRFPFELSGGERRRVAIAGVLALRPKYLIFDNNAVGLDADGRKQFVRRVKDLRSKYGFGIITIGYDVDDLTLQSDRVVVLKAGHVAYDGKIIELLENSDELAEYSLGEPPLSFLLKKLQKSGLDIERTAVTSVSEAVAQLVPILKARK